MKSRMKAYVLLAVRVTLGLALLYYVISSTGDWQDVRALAHPWWLLVGLTCIPFAGSLLEAARLRMLSGAQGTHFRFGKLYRLIAITNLFNLALPGGTGGDLVKLHYLATEKRGKGLEMAVVLVVDRVVALFSWLLIVVLFALFNAARIASSSVVLLMVSSAVGMLGLIVGGAFLMRTNWKWSSRLFHYLRTRAPFHQAFHRGGGALASYSDQPRLLVLGCLISIPGHLMVVGFFSVAASILVPEAPTLLVCLLSLLGMIANLLPLTPGGIGVGEAAFHGLFRMFGYLGAAQLMLAWRLILLPFCAAGSLFYVLGVRERARTEEVVVAHSAERTIPVS